MSNSLNQRDADDAHADDGPPTDAASDEVKADSAADAATETAADGGRPASPRDDEAAVASVEEPTD